MEALELYKEETLKLEQHEEECKQKGKEVSYYINTVLGHITANFIMHVEHVEQDWLACLPLFVY